MASAAASAAALPLLFTMSQLTDGNPEIETVLRDPQCMEMNFVPTAL